MNPIPTTKRGFSSNILDCFLSDIYEKLEFFKDVIFTMSMKDNSDQIAPSYMFNWVLNTPLVLVAVVVKFL